MCEGDSPYTPSQEFFSESEMTSFPATGVRIWEDTRLSYMYGEHGNLHRQ